MMHGANGKNREYHAVLAHLAANVITVAEWIVLGNGRDNRDRHHEEDNHQIVDSKGEKHHVCRGTK